NYKITTYLHPPRPLHRALEDDRTWKLAPCPRLPANCPCEPRRPPPAQSPADFQTQSWARSPPPSRVVRAPWVVARRQRGSSQRYPELRSRHQQSTLREFR